MVIVHTCTMIIGHAVIIVHVSCPMELMFGAIQIGGPGGVKLIGKAGRFGTREAPQWSDDDGGEDSRWLLQDDVISGDGQGWVDAWAVCSMLGRCVRACICMCVLI